MAVSNRLREALNRGHQALWSALPQVLDDLRFRWEEAAYGRVVTDPIEHASTRELLGLAPAEEERSREITRADLYGKDMETQPARETARQPEAEEMCMEH